MQNKERYLELKRAASKRYRLKNADKVKAYRKLRKNQQREYHKKYREEKAEELKIKKSKYYLNNKDKVVKKIKEYQDKNKEKVLQWKRDYSLRNPEVAKAGKRRRRAREMKVRSEKYTTQDVLDMYGINCHICSEPIDLTATRQCGKPGWQHGLHLDHLIPISKGGSDTIDNVRPAHGACNLTKGAKGE